MAGCDLFAYKPHGTHRVELSKEPQKLEISWNQSADTLGIWGYVSLKYNFDVAPEAVPLKVFLFLGDQEVSQVNLGNPITFDSSRLKDGIYKSYLIITATSGTGSLADHLGLETNIVVDSTKHIWVDNGKLAQVEITNFTLQKNGPLKIEWEKYPRPRFAGYQIREGTSCYHGCIRKEFNAIDSTSWVDYNYDGRPRTYSVWVRDVNVGIIRKGPDKLFQTSRRPSTLSSVQKGTNEITFKWGKSKYPIPFHAYAISKGTGLSYGIRDLITIDDINQTEATVPAALGSEAFYYLNVQSKSEENDVPYFTFRSDTVKVAIGSRFPGDISDISLLRYNDTNGRYFVYDRTQGYLYLIDSGNMNILSSKDIGSHNIYTYSASRNRFVVASENQIKIYDSKSLNLIKTINLKDLYPSITSPRFFGLSPLNLSNDGILWYGIARYHSPSTISIGVGAIDLDTESLIDSLGFDKGEDRYISVKPDGQYFYGNIEEKSGYGLYKFDGTSVSLLYPTGNLLDIRFSPDGQSYYGFKYPGSGTVMELRSLNDNSLTWSITLQDISGFTVDRKNNRFSYISKTEGGLVTRSFTNGSVISTIDYAKVSTGKAYTITNDIVWLTNGFYEKLKDLQ